MKSSPSEPYHYVEWEVPRGRLVTCGRPGRGECATQRCEIGVGTIDKWAQGLPEHKPIHIVSLLGRKKDGFSEFGYYPFRSSKETGSKPTFHEWLDERYPGRFVVHEFATTDRMGVPADIRASASKCIADLLEAGKTVVLMDSAGSERTGRVREALGYREPKAAVVEGRPPR